MNHPARLICQLVFVAVAGLAHAAPAKRTIAELEKIADHALATPQLTTSPLPEYDYDQLDYGMTIGMERTSSGRLWACWVAGGDSPKAFFVLATSDDDGESWSKPRMVIDTHSKELPMDRSTLVGNLWTDPTDRLWLFFDQSMQMFDGRGGVWATVCDQPDATDPQWSEPRRIWHGVSLNKPTVLANGEWMLPISLDERGGLHDFKGCFKELDPLRGANVFVSRDQGKTWNRRGRANFPQPDWHEHMIVERRDETLWMLGRTRNGIMESTSADMGRTWSKPVLSAIKHPVARFHIRRLKSGRLLLVKHGDRIEAHTGRVQLSAWLSGDDGKSWQGGLVLDERPGISYPDGVQSPDGTLYISYDRNRSTDGEILMARFNEDDVLAGKLVGSKSRLKTLISRPLKKRESKHLKLADNQEAAPFKFGSAARLTAKDGEIRPLQAGMLIYSNRSYTFFEIPKPLASKRFIHSSIDRTEATCEQAGMAYVLTPVPQRNKAHSVAAQLQAQGFVKAAIPEFVVKTINGQRRSLETCSVFQKEVRVGETVRFAKWGILVF